MAIREEHPPEFSRLLDQARRNAAGSAPRKHHLVPASYLRRWAEDNRIRVTVLDERRSYISTPENAARETDYYRLEHPDLDADDLPPLLFETMLSHVEDNAKGVIDELLEHGDPGRIDPERMALFAWHLGLSVTRGRAFRAGMKGMVADFFRLQFGKITDSGILALLTKHGVADTPDNLARHRAFFDDLQSGKVWVEQPDAALVALSGQIADPIGEQMFLRKWRVYETPPILVTCDEPIVTVGGPGSSRSERAGVGSAGVVLYPLSPTALLALFEARMKPRGTSTLDLDETAEVNREIASNASRWVFERPSQDVAQALMLPPAPDPPFKREGPFPVAGSTTGEAFRTFTPTRWADKDEAPPWPVARWWEGWSHEPGPRSNGFGRKQRKFSPSDTPSGRRPRNRRKARRRGWPH